MNKKRIIKSSHKQTLHYIPKAIQKEYAHKNGNLRLNDKGYLSQGTVVKFKIGAGRVLDAKANGHGSISIPKSQNWIRSLPEGGKTQINVALVEDTQNKWVMEFLGGVAKIAGMPSRRRRAGPTELNADKELKLSACLSECLQVAAADEPFDAFYEKLRRLFESKGQLKELGARHVQELAWPKNAGVYVVWEINQKRVLYIGMTGKFDRSGRLKVGSGLSGRSNRTVPYCFSVSGPFADHFEYNAKTNDPGKIKGIPINQRYNDRRPLKDLRIDCFTVSRDGKAAPAFLEAALLQMYLEQFGCLPVANNAF